MQRAVPGQRCHDFYRLGALHSSRFLSLVLTSEFDEQATKEIDPNHLSHHVHRTGHHIRGTIVEEARAQLEHLPAAAISNGLPESMPETQEEYTAQVNSAILDLFPRIPNTDRQSIILHAFNMVGKDQVNDFVHES